MLAISVFSNSVAKPGSRTAFELTSGGRTESIFFDQAQGTGSWQKIGEFDLAPGATLSIIPAKSKGFIAADGFALMQINDLQKMKGVYE